MIAEFSINPQTDHMSKELARVVEILEQTGLPYRLGAMGTCVEGSWEEVLAAIRRCHDGIARGHERVITSITIDDRIHQPHHLADMVASVEKELEKSAVDSQC